MLIIIFSTITGPKTLKPGVDRHHLKRERGWGWGWGAWKMTETVKYPEKHPSGNPSDSSSRSLRNPSYDQCHISKAKKNPLPLTEGQLVLGYDYVP